MINESNKFPMISLIHPEIGVGSSGGSPEGDMGGKPQKL